MLDLLNDLKLEKTFIFRRMIIQESQPDILSETYQYPFDLMVKSFREIADIATIAQLFVMVIADHTFSATEHLKKTEWE